MVNESVFPWTFPITFTSFKKGRQVDIVLHKKIEYGRQVDCTLNHIYTADHLIDGYSADTFLHTLKMDTSTNITFEDMVSGNITQSAPNIVGVWTTDNLLPDKRCELWKLEYKCDRSDNSYIYFSVSDDCGLSWSNESSANDGKGTINYSTFHDSSCQLRIRLTNNDDLSYAHLDEIKLFYKYDITEPRTFVQVVDKNNVTQDSSNDLYVLKTEVTKTDKSGMDTFEIILDNSHNKYNNYFAGNKDVKIYYGFETDDIHVFTGTIDTVSYRMNEYNKCICILNGKGYKGKLYNRKLTDVNHRIYKQKQPGEIVKDLINTYLPASGITTNNVTTITTPISEKGFESSNNWTFATTGTGWGSTLATDWKTESDHSYKIIAILNVESGSSANITQDIDFTNIDYFKIDIKTTASTPDGWTGWTHVFIDDVSYWDMQDSDAVYTDVSINTQALSGVKELKLSIAERSAASGTEGFAAYFDNIRTYGLDSSNGTLIDITFNENDTVHDAIKQLADTYGYQFWIDEEKDLHFIEDVNTADNWSFDATNNIQSIDYTKTDVRELKNWIKVYGAEGVTDTSQNLTSQTNYERRDFITYDSSASDSSACYNIASAYLDEYDDILSYGQLQTWGVPELQVGSLVWLALDQASTAEEIKVAKIRHIYENRNLTTYVDINQHLKTRWDYIKKMSERLSSLESNI